MKKLFKGATLVAMSAFAVSAFAQGTDLVEPHGVCQSSKYQYDTDGLAGYTYLWEITGGTMGTDYKITKSGAGDKTAVVEWLNPTPEGTTWTFTQQAKSDKNCMGPIKTIHVSVNTFSVEPENGDMCSDIEGYPATVDITLPTEGKCNGAVTHTVTKWKITAIDLGTNITATSTSNHKVGDEITSATGLNTDKFKNAGNANADVTYTLTPYAGESAGSSFSVKVTVYPEVKEPVVKFTAL